MENLGSPRITITDKIAEIAELIKTVDNGDVQTLLTYMFNQDMINQDDLHGIDTAYSAVLDRMVSHAEEDISWSEEAS